MNSSNHKEKRTGCLSKLLIWTVVFLALLHIFTDGDSTKDILAVLKGEDGGIPEYGQSANGPATDSEQLIPTRPTIIVPGLGETEPQVSVPTKPEETQPRPTATRPTQPKPTETKPTQPKPTTPPVDHYPGVPAYLESHYMLQWRESGASKTMTGDVLLVLIFVEDSQSRWTTAERAAATEVINSGALALREEAGEYGAKLEFYSISLDASISGTVSINDSEDWADAAVSAVGYEPDSAIETLCGQYDADEVAIILCADYPGRSFAHTVSGNGMEYAVLFQGTDAFSHELCHVFGAKDYYVYDLYETAGKRLFPDSIMFGEGTVDHLTAYLIGWVDQPSKAALDFLSETVGLSEEEMDQEDDRNTYTGYVTNWETSNGIYTGDLVDGWCHGQGRMEYFDGDRYEGMWEATQLHGTGTYTWVDGDSYTGDWVHGERTGKGTYTWANGTVHVGEFVSSEIIGYGVRTWASGARYEGYWHNGERHGQGKMTFDDGATYTGSWENGLFHGQGSYTWPEGTVHVGAFAAGEITGYGVRTWKSGASYDGDWRNNLRHGQGKMVFDDGNTYIGGWKDGEFHGEGIYTWTSGDSYSGSWANGERHGYGVYTWADGNTRVGYWENGEYIGEG